MKPRELRTKISDEIPRGFYYDDLFYYCGVGRDPSRWTARAEELLVIASEVLKNDKSSSKS